MAEWLLVIDIKTVAMESTGIYWVPLYEILVGRGIEVFLVNARHAKNVPGRKTDISDAQWLQQLHSYGLVRASFQPDPCIAKLRAYFRQRDILGNLWAIGVLAPAETGNAAFRPDLPLRSRLGGSMGSFSALFG